jgi:hypothetical protein
MNAATKLGGFAVGLAVVFAASLGAGRLSGPVDTAVEPAKSGGPHGGHQGGDGPASAPSRPPVAADVPGGLQISQGGYTLVPQKIELDPGVRTDFRFSITGPDGDPVTHYATLHEKKLHLIVARRDGEGFQHLHPTQAGGEWSVPLTLPTAGAYRIFADFQPASAAQSLTLGMDVTAPGSFRPSPPPAPTMTSKVDGYTITRTGELSPGRSSEVTLTVRKDGKPVTDLQPYLGAYGHLVALRMGDLAYLHVHPEGEPGDGKTKPGPAIRYAVEVPSAGTYRLYLDFRHAGVVRTAEFVATVAGATGETTRPPADQDTDQDTDQGNDADGPHADEHGH